MIRRPRTETPLRKRMMEKAKAIHAVQGKRKPAKKPLYWTDSSGRRNLTEHGRREQTKKIRKKDALEFQREIARMRKSEESW